MPKRKTEILDPEAYQQICETRRLLVTQLATTPDDFRGLYLADVFAAVDPERDPELRAHARRAHAMRGRIGAAAWHARARDEDLDVLLFNLCAGMQQAGFGRAALPVLARAVAEVSTNPRILALLRDYMLLHRERAVRERLDAAIAEHAPGLLAGRIERAFVPEALLESRGATVRFHPSGHLASVRIRGDRRNSGRLELDAEPGSGHLVYTAHSGGAGFVVDERYREGAIHSTFCSPWHDGEESSEQMEWSRWVAESLASLESIAPGQRERPSPMATAQVR